MKDQSRFWVVVAVGKSSFWSSCKITFPLAGREFVCPCVSAGSQVCWEGSATRWVPEQAPFPLRITGDFSAPDLSSYPVSPHRVNGRGLSSCGRRWSLQPWFLQVSAKSQWVTGGHTGQEGGLQKPSPGEVQENPGPSGLDGAERLRSLLLPPRSLQAARRAGSQASGSPKAERESSGSHPLQVLA